MQRGLFITLFSISLLVNIIAGYIFIAKNPMNLQGEKSWVELYSDDSDATVKFLNDNLGIKVVSDKNANGLDYRIIKSDKGLCPYAGIMQITEEYRKEGLFPHSIMYLTVKNYDEMHKKFVENGAQVKIENMVVDNMKFGIYGIPGGLDIGIVQYSVKK